MLTKLHEGHTKGWQKSSTGFSTTIRTNIKFVWPQLSLLYKLKFSPVAQSCLFTTPWTCSTPGFSVHNQLPELAQTHVYQVGDAIQPFHPLSSPSPPAFKSFPASGSFSMSQFFTSGGQNIGASASAPVFPMNIQDWFPLGMTGSRVSHKEDKFSLNFKITWELQK